MLGRDSAVVDRSIFRYQRAKKKYADCIVDSHDERVQRLDGLLERLIAANKLDRDKTTRWEVMVFDMPLQEVVAAVAKENLEIGVSPENKVIIPLLLLEPEASLHLEYLLAHKLAAHALRYTQEIESHYQEATMINIRIALISGFDYKIMLYQFATVPLYAWFKSGDRKKMDCETGRYLMKILDGAGCDTGAILAYAKTTAQNQKVNEATRRVVAGMEETQRAIAIRNGLDESKLQYLE